MARDPNEIGTLWFDEWNGRTSWKGDAFEVPSNGITVDLIPFTYTSKKTGKEGRGLRVIRVQQERTQDGDGGKGYSVDEARRAVDDGGFL